jgi:hypothetical protein
MKIKLTAHIHYRKYHWHEEGEFQIMYASLPNDLTLTYIGEQEVEVEVPDSYELIAHQVAALDKLKQKAMHNNQKEIAGINNRISKLQSLKDSE